MMHCRHVSLWNKKKHLQARPLLAPRKQPGKWSAAYGGQPRGTPRLDLSPPSARTERGVMSEAMMPWSGSAPLRHRRGCALHR